MEAADQASLEELFRGAFRKLASGVSVITYVSPDGKANGMTATSVCSVSISPPKLLVCINRQAKTREHIVAAGYFGVNFLSSGQSDISQFCARPGQDKVLELGWFLLADKNPRTPILTGALACLECRLGSVYEEATHSILIGSVVRANTSPASCPLVYFDGSYHTELVKTQPTSGSETLFDDMVRAYS